MELKKVLLFVHVFVWFGVSGYVWKDGQPFVELNNAAEMGLLMPVVGAGTCSVPFGTEIQWSDAEAAEAISQFIAVGGRRIDAANNYASQKGVGEGIAKSGVDRSDLFITAKVDGCYPYSMGYDDSLQQFNDVLQTLQLTYVDLLLIHLPDPEYTSDAPIDPQCVNNCTYDVNDCPFPTPVNPTQCRQSTWKAMEKIFNDGLARAIGISNFEIHHMQDILDMDGLIPSVTQMEHHLYFHTNDIMQWCQQRNITYNSWAPLGDPKWYPEQHDLQYSTLELPLVTQLAAKYGRTAAQINLRWAFQQNIILNPLSGDVTHMKENLDIFDFQLTNDEIQSLNDIQTSTDGSWKVYNGGREWP